VDTLDGIGRRENFADNVRRAMEIVVGIGLLESLPAEVSNVGSPQFMFWKRAEATSIST
jgi:hypothetical protein